MEDLINKIFDKSWNYRNRAQILKRLQGNTYDIIIIGGGITGAGVAREAALRGLKVALIDKQDFAAGTSSRSSKLIHGGIRYLAHGELDLVKEATTERNWLLAHVSHLVRPIPFLFVHWEGSNYKKRTITSATKLYDFLSNTNQEFKNYKNYRWYPPEKIFEFEPKIRKEGNLGGAIYYDNNVDDARLTLETLKEAIIRDADIINYCDVEIYIKSEEKIIGVECKDLESNKKIQIKGKLVVNATGIWTDELIKNYPENIPEPVIRPTKGAHLVYRRGDIKNNMATIIFSITDKRAFFVLPRGDFTIIGTTDTDYKGDLAYPFCDKEDADYLIVSVKHYFPDAALDYKNIVSTSAGIRPLVMQKGKSESEISRKHLIFFTKDNLLTITGGKLTTFRKMAQDLFKEIEKKKLFPDIERKENFSKQKYTICLDKPVWLKRIEESNISLDKKIIDHLYQQYGRGALKILEIIKENEGAKERIIKENDFITAEILYSLRYELTPHLIDVFCRRTEMSLCISHKKQLRAAKKVAKLMADEYSWSEKRMNDEIESYMNYVKKSVAFIE